MTFDIRSFIDEVALPPEEQLQEEDTSSQKKTATVASYLQKTEECRVHRFLRLSVGRSKQDRRKLEQQLLKPEELPDFVGERPTTSAIEQRTVKMIFETDEAMELFRRHFRVNNFKEQNTRDTDIIVALVEALDRGSIEYNATEKTLQFITDNGEQITL